MTMTTIYISGQMSGLEKHEVIKNFSEAEELIEAVGLKPVSPLPIYLRYADLKESIPETPDEKIWDMAMVEAIELLLPCDGIFMQSNWMSSRGARIERNVSVEKGKIILHERTVSARLQKVQEIKDSIYEVTGLRFQDYTGPDKDTNKFFARIIFAYQCKKNDCMKLPELCAMINRAYKNTSKYETKYENEYRVNRKFRAIADGVEEILTKRVSQ